MLCRVKIVEVHTDQALWIRGQGVGPERDVEFRVCLRVGNVGPSEHTNIEFLWGARIGQASSLYLRHNLISKHPGSLSQRKNWAEEAWDW